MGTGGGDRLILDEEDEGNDEIRWGVEVGGGTGAGILGGMSPPEVEDDEDDDAEELLRRLQERNERSWSRSRFVLWVIGVGNWQGCGCWWIDGGSVLMRGGGWGMIVLQVLPISISMAVSLSITGLSLSVCLQARGSSGRDGCRPVFQLRH
jgi:hypothetical protein